MNQIMKLDKRQYPGLGRRSTAYHRDRLVQIYLLFAADENGVIVIAIDRLAAELCLSYKQMRDALNNLRGKGDIETRRLSAGLRIRVCNFSARTNRDDDTAPSTFLPTAPQEFSDADLYRITAATN